MIALIDADILVFEAAFAGEQTVEWEPGEFTVTANLPAAEESFSQRVEQIEEAVGAVRTILALTDSKRDLQFRRKVYPSYKEERSSVTSRRPLVYKALRQCIRDNYEVYQRPGIEADDTLGILATGNIKGLVGGKKTVCSTDKDMLTIPCRLYNWRTGVTRVVSEEEADYFHMIQTLTGDRTDGYPGCPGIGPKKAEQILKDAVGPRDQWELVVAAYEKKGQTEEDALAQARCARILRATDYDFKTKQVRLWEPPSKESA